MKLLTVLFGGFSLALVFCGIFFKNWNFVFAGNFGMTVFLIFTGLAHFRFQKGMSMMIPDFFPGKLFLVYLTGIMEIALGIALLFPSVRYIASVLLILFLVIIFLANINSSRKNINIFKADFSGPGMGYLYRERIPMQIILIVWTWFFGIYLR